MNGLDIATLGIRVDANGAIIAIDQFGNKVEATERKTAAFENRLKSITKWLGVGFLGHKFFHDTVEAQRSLAHLEGAIRSTGGAAGFTLREVTGLSRELERLSGLSGAAVQGGLSRLLTYTGIQRDMFREASRAAVDMAAFLGIDVAMAAEKVGNALQYPSLSLGSLAKQGFRFSDEQKRMIRQFESTNQLAKAQAIIIEELDIAYGGAAQAARDTLGGAWNYLKNQFGSLFSGTKEDTSELTALFNDLGDALEKGGTVSKVFDTAISALRKSLGWLEVILYAVIGQVRRFRYEAINMGGGILSGLEKIPGMTKLFPSLKGVGEAMQDEAYVGLRLVERETQAAYDRIIARFKAKEINDVVGQGGTGSPDTEITDDMLKAIADARKVIKDLQSSLSDTLFSLGNPSEIQEFNRGLDKIVAEFNEAAKAAKLSSNEVAKFHREVDRARQLKSELIAADNEKAIFDRLDRYARETEILKRQTEARRQGQHAVDAFRVKLAGETAVREAMNNAIEKGTAVLLSDINALRLAAEAREQAAINSDAQQKAHADAKQRWEKMLDSMQKHISSFWSDLFSNGIKSFKSLFDRVRQLFAQLVADLLAKRMVQRLSGLLATAIGLGGPQAASAQGMIGSIIPLGVNSNHGTSYPGTPVTSGWGQAMQLGGAGLGGFGIGYGLGSTTTNQGMGGVMGAAGGAASGFAIGGPAGAAIGSLTGLVGGLLGSSKAADEADKQLRRMKESLELAMSAIRSEVNGTADSLSHSLLQANAQFKQLREQVEDTYRLNVWEALGKETKNSKERARLLAELNTMEEKRLQQLKEEYDLKIQHTQEDLQVRLLRAKGMDNEAEEMEFMLRQQREYDEMKKAGMDDETMALLAQVQLAEKAAFAAKEIEKLTASLSNAPSGFKIAHDRYLATIASIPGEDVIGRPFADPRDIPSPNPPLITSNGGGMAMPQASGTTVIEFHGDLHITSSATNAEELFQEIQRKLQLEAARGGTTRFTLNTRTS